MIEESTRPATIEDLEAFDRRRYSVMWADGTPWGCLLWIPLGTTAVVAASAALFASAGGRWGIVAVAAGWAALASFFISLTIIGGEWARLRWKEHRRPARAQAHAPIRVLRASADRAWVVVDVHDNAGMPFVVFDTGGGEVLCVDAATALGLKKREDYRKAPPPTIMGEIEIDLEPGVDWPLKVRLSGEPVPLIDLLIVDPRPQLLENAGPSSFPLRLRHGQLSPEMRELVTTA